MVMVLDEHLDAEFIMVMELRSLSTRASKHHNHDELNI